MKAQLVKNAVIVPTGAKGGFYPKQLPNPARSRRLARRRHGQLPHLHPHAAVDHRQYRRGRRSSTRRRRHPRRRGSLFRGRRRQGHRDLLRRRQRHRARTRGFWLGDAFASGGSNGYDHKAMGITARGAWISVQRHFLEMGIDVQTEPIRVAGCGDMSGDVFGNGMLLSKAIKLVAAFDHRHIFIDPDPDPAARAGPSASGCSSCRARAGTIMTAKISEGGGIFPRSQKSIPLTPAGARRARHRCRRRSTRQRSSRDPQAPVDLLWFGGIGTYVKASGHQNHAEVGDPATTHRVDAVDLGEGDRRGREPCHHPGRRIEFAEEGGRINTDFIDNSPASIARTRRSTSRSRSTGDA
jgi:glutamate dehydrogenase